jgi:hypothetical protein
MDAGQRASGSRRRDRAGFVALAVAIFLLTGVAATWPAIEHVDGNYLAGSNPGYGEAPAGDYLQLTWNFWLPGHQLEHGAAPWRDPYSFLPESSPRLNLQGWLFGLPFWPINAAFGPAWGYDVVLLLSYVLAGGFACWWLRSIGLPRGPALAGGVAFALAPYRVEQSTGHLLGMVGFLLPAMLLALERRRFVLAALALVAIPLSGQVHLAVGAVPLFAVYAWVRLSDRRERLLALVGAAAAIAAGFLVQRLVIATSVVAGGRSLGSVRHYSAIPADFLTRSQGRGVEQFVFIGWVTPLIVLAGVVAVWRRDRRLTWLLAGMTLVPAVLALGTHVPLYSTVWHVFSPLRYPRVPERLMPIACLALAAFVGFAATWLRRQLLVAVLVVVLFADLHVHAYGTSKAYAHDAAYAALDGRKGVLLELPMFHPDIHLGSTYLAYAMQSPRQRPLGYSTTAPLTADGWAKRHAGLNCAYGDVPWYVTFVAVHRGVYKQGGYRSAVCPDSVEHKLVREGFRLLARSGPIAMYART